MNKISDAIRLRKKRQWFKDMFFIFLGTLTYSFGYTAFVLPEKVVMGGVAGISALLYYAFGLLPGISIWVLNITLLLVAMKALSRQFIVRTVIGVTMLSALIGALQPVFQMFPMITAGEDKFMHVLIGGALGGAGLGLVFSHNGSTGGTDIIIALLNKKFSMSFGRAMQFIDITIISSSYLLFRSMETIVYGICLIYTGADPMGGFKSSYTQLGSGTTLELPGRRLAEQEVQPADGILKDLVDKALYWSDETCLKELLVWLTTMEGAERAKAQAKRVEQRLKELKAPVPHTQHNYYAGANHISGSELKGVNIGTTPANRTLTQE